MLTGILLITILVFDCGGSMPALVPAHKAASVKPIPALELK